MKTFIKDIFFIIVFFPFWTILIFSLPENFGTLGEIIGIIFFLSLAAWFYAIFRIIFYLYKKRAKP